MSRRRDSAAGPARASTAGPTLAALVQEHAETRRLVHIVAAALLRALDAASGPVPRAVAAYLAALELGLAPFMADIPAPRVTRPRPAGVQSGICAFCGCRAERPCTGCLARSGAPTWANDERTICATCDLDPAVDGIVEAPAVRALAADATRARRARGRQGRR